MQHGYAFAGDCSRSRRSGDAGNRRTRPAAEIGFSLAGDLGAILPGPYRPLRSGAAQLHHRHRRTRPGPGKRGRGGDCGGALSRSVPRHSLWAKGYRRCPGRGDHRPFAADAGHARDRRRPCHQAARCRGWHYAGQAGHVRVRVGRSVLGPALAAAAQSVEHRLPARRIVIRIGFGRRGALHSGGDWHRYGWVGPLAGRVLRHCRAEADLWVAQPARRAAQHVLPGSLRPDDPHGARLRADAGRLRRTRPAGPRQRE